MNRAFTFLACLLFPALLVQAQSNILATAQVEPETVMVGDTATYMIRIINASSLPNLNTPRVDGLEISSIPSQGSYTQIINGRQSIESRLSWQFRAIRPGTFTFPGRTITIQGEELRLPEVTVTAVPMSEEKKSRHSLELTLPEGPFFVGQAIPAQLTLAIRSDLDVGNITLPQRNGDAFINTEFSRDPVRSQKRINGRIYSTLEWSIVITPIKSGQQSLDIIQTVTLQFPAEDPRFPSMFGLSRSRSENVTLSTELPPLTILEVPTKGRPDSYRDAIGEFSASIELSSNNLTVGEPVTLKLKIDGIGNFDRITAPEIPQSDLWRAYSPKSDFFARSNLNNSGIKQFEYILIPQSEDITLTPEINFSYFNPATSEFVPVPIPRKDITVKPSTVNVAVPDFSNYNEDDELAAREIEKQKILRPILPTIGSLSPVNRPVWTSTAFISLQVFFATILVLTILVLTIRYRRDKDPLFSKKQLLGKDLKFAMDACNEAIKANNATAFYDNARLALKLKIAKLDSRFSRTDPRSLVTDDLFKILRDHNASNQIISQLDELMQEADAFHFAGNRMDHATLSASALKLNAILSSIDSLS